MIEKGLLYLSHFLISSFLSVDSYSFLYLIKHKDVLFYTGAIILIEMQWCICSREDYFEE